MLEIEEVLSIVNGSFHPLKCVAEVWNHNSKICFRVFDSNNEPLLTVPDEDLNALRDEAVLFSTLESARFRIRHKGFELSEQPKEARG